LITHALLIQTLQHKSSVISQPCTYWCAKNRNVFTFCNFTSSKSLKFSDIIIKLSSNIADSPAVFAHRVRDKHTTGLHRNQTNTKCTGGYR